MGDGDQHHGKEQHYDGDRNGHGRAAAGGGMTGKNNLVAVEPPGTFIKLELEARGWSQRDLAFILGQTEQQLNPLLSGKRGITPDMARLLGDAFDVSPQFFLNRSEEHTSELQSLMRISYAVFCLKKKKNTNKQQTC